MDYEVVVAKAGSTYVVNRNSEAVAQVGSGAVVRLQTENAYGGRRVDAATIANQEFFARVVPLAGPVVIDGARAGQWLAVTIRAMALESTGYLLLRRNIGLLGRYWRHEPKPYEFRISGDEAENAELGTVQTRPMLGVVCVAPERGTADSKIVGEHGGNLDVVELGVGTTIVLPIHVDGAYLFAGDGHAMMGHGELGGTGIEVGTCVDLEVKEVEGLSHLPSTLSPLVWTDDGWLAVIGRGKTVDGAIGSGLRTLRTWLSDFFKTPEFQAAIALRGEIRICQVVNNLFTAAVGLYCDPVLRNRVEAWLVE